MSGEGTKIGEESEEYYYLYKLERMVEEAVDYALSRLSHNGMKLSRSDVPRTFLRCMYLFTTGFEFEDLERLDLVYLEFYKFFKKYLEERCWFIIWRLFELRGIRVSKFIISDRMGGEGLHEFRYYMGRDIDCMIVVEGDLRKAKGEAIRIEGEINGVVGNRLQKIILEGGKLSEEELKNCKTYDLFELEIFDKEEDARRWGVIREYTREDYRRKMAGMTFLGRATD
ncbi:MAG: hypothetical protein QI197_07250 [Candidatus Korarchaeota archaeon]|nr:hypothetical protein [Candidatus Korarchaeota archaeon]